MESSLLYSPLVNINGSKIRGLIAEAVLTYLKIAPIKNPTLFPVTYIRISMSTKY